MTIQDEINEQVEKHWYLVFYIAPDPHDPISVDGKADKYVHQCRDYDSAVHMLYESTKDGGAWIYGNRRLDWLPSRRIVRAEIVPAG